MKKLILATLVSTVAFTGTPTLAPVEINKIYSPTGFDSNDKAEIIISGWLPNACQKLPTYHIKKINKNIDISVNALLYDQSNPYCPPEKVPFTHKVKLGILNPGSYELEINKKQDSASYDRLRVVNAEQASVDSNKYPFVTKINVDQVRDRVHLTALRESDCYALDSVEIINDGKNTYSVMPVLKNVIDFCPKKMQPISVSFDMPDSLNSKKVLLHVRSTSGKAINKIIKN
jgi:hypothetical protein